jgi:hypothetical protein
VRSPTELSLHHLRTEGWTVDVCERWIPGAGVAGGTRRDLFGVLDLVGLRGPETLGVQTTSALNVSARLNKMRDAEHAERLAALHAAGWSLVIHGWRLSTRDGHACPHGRPRCGCRWSLHRLIPVDPLEVS